jgi:hypothetical protein
MNLKDRKLDQYIEQLTDVIGSQNIKDVNHRYLSESEINFLYDEIVKEKNKNQEPSDRQKKYSKEPKSERRLKKIKRTIFNKLINLLFLIESNQPKYKDRKSAYYYCQKYAAAVHILNSRGAKLAAIGLGERILKISDLYEFTDISLNLSLELMLHYSSVDGNRKKSYFHEQKIFEYTKIYNAEILAQTYYSKFIIGLIRSRAANQEHHALAVKFSEELEDIILTSNSHKLNLITYIITAFRYELVSDYANVNLVCNRALEYFKSRKYNTPNSTLFTFLFRQIPSLILLNKMEEAIGVSEECLQYINSGYNNWFKTHELRFIIFMHSNNIKAAFETYQKAINHKNFSKQFPDTKEIWFIYEAYLYYFYLKNSITVPVNERLKKFRVNKFLNEVPNYSKDKRGMNISILILQVLFLLHQKKYGKIIDRAEALRTYTHRYLRKDATFRSNCFLKMLLQLPGANFHRVAVERKTADLRKKLSSVGIINNQSAEVEIIPYEVLWELVLDSLENKIWHK